MKMIIIVKLEFSLSTPQAILFRREWLMHTPRFYDLTMIKIFIINSLVTNA